MWQIQWMLSLIPDSVLLWFINIILLVGAIGFIASYFAKLIPFVTQYRIPVQIISVVLLVCGVYLKGGYGIEMAWRDKLRVAEEKAKIAEEKSKELNANLDAEVKKKKEVIKENTIVYRDRIVKQKEIIDKECKVPQVALDILNDAALNRKPEAKK